MVNQDSASSEIAVLSMPKKVAAGETFGQLTVLYRVSNDLSGRVRLHCKCECGAECDARLSDLRSGHTRSCGVPTRQKPSAAIPQDSTQEVLQPNCHLGKCKRGHGINARTKWMAVCVFCHKLLVATTYQIRRGKKKMCRCLKPTYNSWRNMIQRCTNENHDQYKDYGGRGIRVCEEWRNCAFQHFAMEMGRRPLDTTLDRIDPDGPCTVG